MIAKVKRLLHEAQRIRGPKILLFDLETTDLRADWGVILCTGYKWLGHGKPQVISLPDYKQHFAHDCTDDSLLVRDFREIMVLADMFITWYGERFDVPMVNSKLVKHGLQPLPPITHFDGWKTAKYRMNLSSNRLANVSSFLGLEEKTPVKGEVWKRAVAGYPDAIKYVEEHCLQDIVVLEQAYERLRPFAPTHLNLNLVQGTKSNCPRCGSNSLQRRGTQVAQARSYQRFQCTKCGSWCRSRKSDRETIVEVL